MELDLPTLTAILVFMATIGVGIVAELLRRILIQLGSFSKHLTVLETTIALCPHCPKQNNNNEVKQWN